jgi:glycosyltransferase involved in cell wall biosynthesis
MKVLCLFPSLSLEADANAETLLHICEQGHDLLVVASRGGETLKGRREAPEHETRERLRFYRPFRSMDEMRYARRERLRALCDEIGDFAPDVIYCSGEFNLRAAAHFKARFRAPVVLLMEFLSADRIVYPHLRGRTALRRWPTRGIFPILRRLYFRRIRQVADCLLYVEHNPGEEILAHLEDLGLPHAQVSWPAKTRVEDVAKEEGTGIHVGSLYDFKNAGEFRQTLPLIMERTETRRFTVVGPGPLAGAVIALQARYPGRIVYKESVPRDEAETMIAKSHYGYTPVRAGGLGFIGDCWAHGAPLVATASQRGYLRDGNDALVVDSPAAVPEAIARILGDPALARDLTESGYQRHLREKTPQIVGQKHIEAFEFVLGRRDSL